jgi:glycosyltransferase involved in cell wall biosynthesis
MFLSACPGRENYPSGAGCLPHDYLGEQMEPRWRILLLDTKECNPNHYILLAIESALKEHCQVELVRSPCWADALPAAIRARCNLFIAFGGEGLDRGLCRRLASVCGTSVLWVTEDPYDLEVNNRNAELFDLVFTNDSGSVSSYRAGAEHLPLAASPRFNFHEVPAADEGYYLYDVLFVGTAWPNRVQLLKALRARFPWLRIKLVLPTNQHLPIADIGLPQSAYLWRVPNPEMARLANRSRVVLTLHRNFAHAGKRPRAATPGPRLFEVALAGAFQLVDLSLPEAEAYFQPGKEIAGFKTTEECWGQLHTFLTDPQARLAIAHAGQGRCLAEHLYEHRVHRLLRLVACRKREKEQQPPPLHHPRNRRNRLLFVSHNVINVRPVGGVEVYLDRLARHLPERYEPYAYYPDRRYPLGQVMVFENLRSRTRTRRVFSRPVNQGALQDLARECCFADLLHEQRIDLVHFQHLIGHPWSLPLVARTLGIPVGMTFHDYFAVCPHFNLIDAGGHYCRFPKLSSTACDRCLEEQSQARPGSQASRRSFIAGLLDNLDLMIFPSQSSRAIGQAAYPLLRDDSRVRVLGVPLDECPRTRRHKTGAGPLKAVVLGNLDHVKGGDVFCTVFRAMRDEPIEFHVHGHVRPPYDDTLRDLAVPNLKVHGPYEPDVLPQTLSEADVGLFLSIWPESYLLTLSEAWRAGLVPIVSDIGAPAERVTHGVNGLKVPVDEPDSVVRLLRELIADRKQIERLREGIRADLYGSIGEHVRQLVEHYEILFETYRVRRRGQDFYDERPARRQASADNLFRLDVTWLSANANTAPTLGGRPVWEKVLPYLRKHGVKATARRSAEKVLEKLTLLGAMKAS